jgi:hypothetical protein
MHGELMGDGMRMLAGHPVNYFVGDAATGLASLRLLRAALRTPDALAVAYVSQSALRLLLKSGVVHRSGALHDCYSTVARPAPGRPGAWPVPIARGLARLAWRTWLAVAAPGLYYCVASRLEDTVAGQFIAQAAKVHYICSA